VLLDNGHLGLVRQQQELFYGERYVASRFHAEPDFVALARAFGMDGVDLGAVRGPAASLAHALASPGPALVRVPIAHAENVYPMVPPGAPNREMIRGWREQEHDRSHRGSARAIGVRGEVPVARSTRALMLRRPGPRRPPA
jgi:hypothetical protein